MFFISLLLLFFLSDKLLGLENEPITPIPTKIDFDYQKALLGKVLFFDKSFSKDKRISCASCHMPEFGMSDPRKVSVGVDGKKGVIQSLTILNAVFNFRQFWNGRAKNLYQQIDGPIHNSVEMGFSEKEVEKVINSKRYKKMFKRIYNDIDRVTYHMFKEVIVEFEKSLITPNCKFDKWLRGEVNLKENEYKGYLLFKELGCINCHNGVNIGGNSFQKIGVIYPMKNRVGDRYSITLNPLDKFLYKTPTLRNIVLTAPYFHDGSAQSLEEAIIKMGYLNLGVKLEAEKVKEIKAFLYTLTGETPPLLLEVMRGRR